MSEHSSKHSSPSDFISGSCWRTNVWQNCGFENNVFRNSQYSSLITNPSKLHIELQKPDSLFFVSKPYVCKCFLVCLFFFFAMRDVFPEFLFILKCCYNVMVGESYRCTLKYSIIIKKNRLNQPFCSVFHSNDSDNKMEASQIWSSTVGSEAVKSWFSDCMFTLKRALILFSREKRERKLLQQHKKKNLWMSYLWTINFGELFIFCVHLMDLMI